ncbi:restriction endonuclease subunit S [Methanosarcina thermophila]|uniref:Type I restriction-modification system, specificity subunit S n=1 Tax=Methanosarcina thermophila CHTI-55 TaxID=1434121 RepID=A0A0E3KS52_METTE|nr:restriction endonuclease subunit S [Methanosarcina thermophila]AKB16573.1 Type I restriction-modification system, specificity subunit S [Methanosarcina thermophila CHTI-55]
MASETKFKKTEIGMIPEDWKILTLENAMESIIDYRGKTPKKTDSGIPLITAKIVKNGRILEPNEFISPQDYESWMRRGLPKPGDVVITTEAPMGEVAQLDERKVALAQRLITLRGKKGMLHNNFLRFVLQSPNVENELKKRESGTTVTGIKQKELRKALLPIPPYDEQIKLSEILISLDNKIDLNHQMNSTLEQIAQTLFKHWFIDFEFPDENGNPYKSSGGRMVDSELGEIPEGWKIGVLGDFCEIIMGQSPPGKTYNEEGKGLPFHQGITDFGFRFPSRRVYCTEPKRIAEKGDVLLSVRAPVGSLNVADQKYAIGRGLAALKLKRDHGSYLFYLMKATQSRWNIFESEGTVFGSIGKSDIYNFKTIIPPQNLISKFNDLIKPLDERIACNEKNNHILSLTRDSLLPKLMSGKIRVQV